MAPRKRKETPKIEVKEEEIDYKHVVPEAALGLIDSMEIQGLKSASMLHEC